MTDDIKAIRDALDDDELRELRTAADCAGLSQEFARLLDALEAAKRDAERYRWLRANFTTDPLACGLHACETPERLDAHFDAAITASLAQSPAADQSEP